MNGTLGGRPWRLADLPLAAKVLLTAFLALVGVGYLVAVANIYFKHREADFDPALTPDDIRAVYHGMEKTITSEAALPSEMLKEVRPGGRMRKHLQKGGDVAVTTLIAWLEQGAKEADFAKAGFAVPGGPSPKDVIRAQCIGCHAPGGDEADIPYAPSTTGEPDYAMVAKMALPPVGRTISETRIVRIDPTSVSELVHITHAHILTIPIFALLVGLLFLLTGLPEKVKLIVGPLPMLAVLADIASWWLARPFEPFVHVIAAAGAVFGATFGLQVLCVFGSLWFGRGSERTA